MIYLLWGLTNIGFYLCFIVLCFSATKLIREKKGRVAAAIFVWGSLSFIIHSRADNGSFEENSNKYKIWKFVTNDSLISNKRFIVHEMIDKEIAYNITMDIVYEKDNQTQLNIPIEASTIASGLTAGINWKPELIKIDKPLSNNRLEYYMKGVIDWQLFGFTIYTESKAYIGIVTTK